MTNTCKYGEAIRLFLLMAAVVASFGTIIHNANIMYQVREFKVDKLEKLNKSTNGLERAQFKELESCVRADTTLANETVSGTWMLKFSPERGGPVFNSIVDKCLTKLKHQAIYQQLSITNINQVKDAITQFATVEPK